MSSKKYDVITPDGFSISRDQIWDTPEEAIEAAKKWVKGYERQGYYSSNKFGRIDLEDLLDYCDLREVEPVAEIEDDELDNEPF